MLKKIVILILLLTGGKVFSQKPAYKIFNAKGKGVSYKKMIKELAKKDIILFGELHNNPIAHWLQYESSLDLSKKKALILGAEMIEADNQALLSEYLKDSITYEHLDSTARLWPNYKTDYAPLVDFAKNNQIPFIATNIPRRYAKMVHHGGFETLDSLSDQEKEWIAPLPIPFDGELATYKYILEMMGDHGSINLVKAQASKDATMAYFILDNYEEEHLFMHFNGAYHSDNYEGILWYLKRENPTLRYATITTVSQENVNKLSKENKKIADYIIVVDSNMTLTY